MVRAGSMTAISDFQKWKSRPISDLRDCAFAAARKHGDMDVIAWLNTGLRKLGKSKGGLAKALAIPPSAISAMLVGDRKLKLEEVVPAADYLEIDPPTFFRSRFVPLLGKVAAGNSEALLYADNGGPIDWVQTPFHSSGAVAALEVEGDSMPGLAEEGFLVFVGERHSPPTAEQLRQLCVCRLTDGRRVVKFLTPSLYDGRYDLKSSDGNHILAADVEWAAVVTNIVPTYQAAQLERRSEADDAEVFLKIENLT